MAQLVERVLGKDEVSSSNLDSSSKDRTAHGYGLLLYIRFELLVLLAKRNNLQSTIYL